MEYDVDFGAGLGTIKATLFPIEGAASVLGTWSRSGPGTISSVAVSAPGEVYIEWTACSVTYDTSLWVGDSNCNDCQNNACPTCVGDPVRTSTGNMRFTDTDPLPGAEVLPLIRTYDSLSPSVGYFGRRWASLFDARARAYSLGSSDPSALVLVIDESADPYLFRRPSASSPYVQVAPAPRTAASTLQAAGGGWIHRDADGRMSRQFGSDGRIARYVNAVGRGITIHYSTTPSRPDRVDDDWGRPAWFPVYNNDGYIERINFEDQSIHWAYEYDGDRLDRVISPEGVWREYNGSGSGQDWRITEIVDALGHVVETHDYDSLGRATSSSGPSAEITGITYQVGTAPDDFTTMVTHKTGRVETHVMRTIAGKLRTVQLSDSCTTCGAGDGTYVYDYNGNVTRDQEADGYITESVYDLSGANRLSVRTALKPSGCDPAIDAAHCLMISTALAAADLVETTASLTTSFAYVDANWPQRPTSVIIRSLHWVAVPPDQISTEKLRTETFQYDPLTGTVLVHEIEGWTGSGAPTKEKRTTTTTLYDGTEGAVFNPGGTVFISGWLTLAQPAGMTKRVDGPRPDTDALDYTKYVYYPTDTSVPVRLRGRVAAISRAGLVTRFDDYDLFGTPIITVDPNGVQTTVVTDGLGRRTSVTLEGIAGCTTDSLCSTDLTTSFTYHDAGSLETEQRPLGGVTAYEYDTRSRLAAVSRGPSATDLRERAETAYDANTGKRSLERKLAKEGAAWVEKTKETFVYYPDGLLKDQVHADNTFVQYTYDPEGHIASSRDEIHTSPNTTYAYDPAGRLKTVTQALATAAGGLIATSYGYDPHGNLNSVTDPNGNPTAYLFDDFGQMVKQTSVVTGITTYEYDLAGNLTTTLDANVATTVRTYDAFNRILTAASTRTGYPPDTVTWSYDDASVSSFAKGRLTTMTSGSGAVKYKYDRRGLLIEERSPDDRAYPYSLLSTLYGYDANGNRSWMRYPGLLNVLYTFDYADRAQTANARVTIEFSEINRTIVSSATYLPFGPARELVFGNGTTRTIDYDNRYRPSFNTLTRPGGNIARYSYVHDDRGNITKIADALDSSFDRTYGYDDLNRLTSTYGGQTAVPSKPIELWGNATYTYDSMGNMKTASLGEASVTDPDGLSTPDPRAKPLAYRRTFTYDGITPKLNNVAEWGRDQSPEEPTGESFDFRKASAELRGRSVTYDFAGNETGFVASRTYSPRNNLLWKVTDWSETGAAQHEIQYGYDGRGVRIQRSEYPATEGGDWATRYFYYTPELQLLAVSEDTGPNLWAMTVLPVPMRYQIIWFAGLPVAQTRNDQLNALRYTFTDHLGTPLLQTDANANVVWQAEYEPFGSIYKMRVGERLDQPLRFPGQEAAMTWEGMEENYNIFRWYRAGWGRYTSPDPWELYLYSENAFAYVGGNPVRRRDPLGLFAIDKSCNKQPFQGVASAFDSMCKKTTNGTQCGNALKGVSLVLFGSDNKLSNCFKSQCSGTQTTVKCDCDFSKGCAQNVKSVGENIITMGPGGPGCPNGKLGSFEETAFHETLHSSCALGAAEPDTPSVYGKMFKYLEKKCYGWTTP